MTFSAKDIHGCDRSINDRADLELDLRIGIMQAVAVPKTVVRGRTGLKVVARQLEVSAFNLVFQI
jgi:hypothetical protein